MMRGGPGLGNIQASQGDYFQAVKGGGHGDYHLVVFAPSSTVTDNRFDSRAGQQLRIKPCFLDGLLLPESTLVCQIHGL